MQMVRLRGVGDADMVGVGEGVGVDVICLVGSGEAVITAVITGVVGRAVAEGLVGVGWVQANSRIAVTKKMVYGFFTGVSFI